MKKIAIIVTCLLAAVLVSCGGNANKPETAKESTEEGTIDKPEEETDYFKLYEKFVAKEIAKMEKNPTPETVVESAKANVEFFAKHGDPATIEMTAEKQAEFKALRETYVEAMAKIAPRERDAKALKVNE